MGSPVPAGNDSARSPGPGFLFSAWAPWLAAVIFAAVVLTTVFSYFDVTDEGLYLYLMAAAPHPIYITPFHALYHPFGSVFGHSLLGYRLLNLACLLGGSAFFAWQAAPALGSPRRASELLPWVLIGAFFAMTPIYTPSYHNVAVVTTLVWLGSVLALMTAESPSAAPSASLAAAVVLSSFSRPQLGALLALYTLALLLAPGFRRTFRKDAAFAVCLLAAAWLHRPAWDYLQVMRRIVVLHMATTHSNPLTHNAVQALSTVRAVWPLLAALLASVAYVRRARKSGVKEAFGEGLVPLAVILAMAALMAYRGARAGSVNGLAPLAALVFLHSLARLRKPPAEHVLPALLSLAVAFTYSFGSHNNMFPRALWHPALVITLGLLLLRKKSPSFSDAAPTYALIGVMLALLAQTALANYYRSGSFARQVYPADGIPLLSHIKVREDIGRAMRALGGAMRELKLGPDTSVIAYPDIPGFVAVSRMRAMGDSWYPTGFPHIDEENCAYLRIGAEASAEPVYLLTAAELSPGFAACVNALYRPAPAGFASRPLGEFHDFRSGSLRSLGLSGPFIRR